MNKVRCPICDREMPGTGRNGPIIRFVARVVEESIWADGYRKNIESPAAIPSQWMSPRSPLMLKSKIESILQIPKNLLNRSFLRPLS